MFIPKQCLGRRANCLILANHPSPPATGHFLAGLTAAPLHTSKCWKKHKGKHMRSLFHYLTFRQTLSGACVPHCVVVLHIQQPPKY
jgi:hypothetical protein